MPDADQSNRPHVVVGPRRPGAEPAPYRPRHALPEPHAVSIGSASTHRPAPRTGAVLPDRDLAQNRANIDRDVEVARRLDRLDVRWQLLHGVPVDDEDGEVDHVVIGPGGVFTINTENHPNAKVWVRGDTFKVNGFNHDCVRGSRQEARHAAELLSEQAGFRVDVRGIVAVVGAHRGVTVSEQPRDSIVTVLAGKTVADFLAARPEVLDADAIEHIYAVARHLATWQPWTVMWQDFEA